jgi:F0F1-type ATP synthase assembly protein I
VNAPEDHQDQVGKRILDNVNKNVTKDFGPFLTSGLQLAISVVVFFFIGYWLDGKLGTSPWCTIGGASIGATGGLIKFLRDAMALGKQADKELKEIEKEKREG